MVTMAPHIPTDGIIHSLMCHRVGRETESFARRAIESLVKKLLEKKNELNNLILTITTNGAHHSECVTIQRTLDGRLQIAGKKGFPHVIYARIWRWPSLHKNELKHATFCKFAFDLQKESVCINPYHYERFVSTGFDLSGLTLNPAGSSGPQLSDEYSNNVSMPISDHDRLVSERLTVQHLPTDSFLQQSDSKSFPTHHSPSQHFLSPVSTAKAGTSSYKWHTHSNVEDASMRVLQGNSDSGEHLSSPYSSPAYQPVSPAQQVIHSPGLSPSSSSGMSTCSRPMSIPLVTNHANLTLEMYRSVQNQTFLRHYPEVSGTTWVDTTPPVYSKNTAYWINEGHAQADITSQTSLSIRPHQEYWCKQTYFELDQQVGEIFKVPYTVKTVTIDGYTDPSNISRFCLGKLSNVNRTEMSERARLHIGKGVQLDYIGDGDVWIRCIGKHSVFIQSLYLDKESGRSPGNAVHKIYPNAYVKIFDIKQCYYQMYEQVATSHAAGVAQAKAVAGDVADLSHAGASVSDVKGIAVDDFRRNCLLRFSFVKGWGPDYNRKSIKDTPCWVEIQLHRPLKLLDEVLQSMPSNDIYSRRYYNELCIRSCTNMLNI